MHYVSVLLAIGGFAPPHRLQSCGGPAICYDNDTGCQYSLVRFFAPRDTVSVPKTPRELNKSALAGQMRGTGNHLRQLVDQVLAEQERAAAEGKRPERLWKQVTNQKGTPYLGERN